jgi:hypothetical protein
MFFLRLLAYILLGGPPFPLRCDCPTDFATAGVSLMVCVWKLNGFLVPAEGGLPVPLLSKVSKVSKDGVAGLPILLPDDFIGDVIDPNRPENVSVFGDSVFGSQETVEYTVRSAPPIPNPSGSSGSGVGGVGVRGGAGIGRLEAIVADYRFLKSMGRSADNWER